MGEEIRETIENEVVETAAEMTTEPVQQEVLVQSEEPVQQEVPVQSEEPVQQEVPVQSEEPVQQEVPVQSEEPVQQEVPVQSKEPVQQRSEVWRPEENSPYSPLYVPDKKQKNSNKITIVFVIILVLCLVAGMIFAVSKLIEAAVGEVSAGIPSWQETFDNWKSDSEDYFAKEDDDDWEDEYDDYEFDYDDEFEYDDDGAYVPSPNDEYYVELADAIEDDFSYTVDKEEYTYYDDDELVGIYVEYVTVDGLDFDDKINEKLEEGAMYYAKNFGAGNVSKFSLEVVSYVTYMDEDMLSVVVDERYSWDNEVHVDLYCMNFDLKTGSLLYNTDIIDPTEELAEDFRDMNDYQNGYIEHVDEISDDDIVDYFSDEDSLILFYTPVGLEIGFNYEDGWVTATLKDYEEYLSRL